jgi:hypothetical protein
VLFTDTFFLAFIPLILRLALMFLGTIALLFLLDLRQSGAVEAREITKTQPFQPPLAQ